MRVREIDPGGPIDRNSPDQFKVSIGQPDGLDAGGVGHEGGLAGPEGPRRALRRVVQAGQEAGTRFSAWSSASPV